MLKQLNHGTWLLICLLPLALTGCTHAQAKTVPDAPPLDMPAPPPRDVEPVGTETAAPEPALAPAPESARGAAPRPRAPREPPRPDPPKPEPPKPEPPKPEPPKQEPPKPAAPLQNASATVEGEVERAIRATLTHATTDLNRIDYRALNADARTQYDTAKRFIQQAEDAVRAKNLVFAKGLADKAAALATQLAGR